MPGISSEQLAVARQIDSQNVEVQIIAKIALTQVRDVGVAFADPFHACGHKLGAVGFAVEQGHGLDTFVIFYRDRERFFIVRGGMIEHGRCLFVIQQSGLMFVLGVGRCGNTECGEQGSEHDCREWCPSVH